MGEREGEGVANPIRSAIYSQGLMRLGTGMFSGRIFAPGPSAFEGGNSVGKVPSRGNPWQAECLGGTAGVDHPRGYFR